MKYWLLVLQKNNIKIIVMISVQTLRKIYFSFAMIASILITWYMLINDDNMNATGTQRTFLMRSLFCIVWIIPYFWYMKDVFLQPISTKENPYRLSSIKWFTVYTICTCVAVLLTNDDSIKEFIATIVLYLCPYLIFTGSYVYSHRFNDKSYTTGLVILMIIVCIYAYIAQYNLYNVLDVRGRFAIAYYPLYLLPIALTSNKKWIRYIAIVLISIVLFSSLKRGGVVALVLGMAAYVIVNQYMKHQFTFVFRSIILLVILLVIGYIGVQYFGESLIERFLNEDDTTGSGRTEIWASLYARMQDQDYTAWLFGNGHLATMRDSSLHLSAHNDFLEIIYNYGIFSLLAYICFLLSILRYTLQAIRHESKYAANLAMLFTIYVTLSMVSIIVLLHTATLALLSYGLLIGWNEHERHQPNILEKEQTTLT